MFCSGFAITSFQARNPFQHSSLNEELYLTAKGCEGQFSQVYSRSSFFQHCPYADVFFLHSAIQYLSFLVSIIFICFKQNISDFITDFPLLCSHMLIWEESISKVALRVIQKASSSREKWEPSKDFIAEGDFQDSCSIFKGLDFVSDHCWQ